MSSLFQPSVFTLFFFLLVSFCVYIALLEMSLMSGSHTQKAQAQKMLKLDNAIFNSFPHFVLKAFWSFEV